jgi:uncharacterized protein YvpB
VRQPATVLASLAVSAAMIGGSVGSVVAGSQAVPDRALAHQEMLYQQDGSSVWVPSYVQQRNLSCEYAAAVIAMAAYGVWVNEYDFDGLVGWSENPHWGYRGDITGWWGNTEDYGVYASALAPAIRNFGFWAEEFYAQGDASTLTNRIDSGAPVIVWLGLWGDTGFYQWTAEGTPYKLVSGMHVVVAYGYDSGGVWVSDPATGGKTYYDWGTFMTYWNVLNGMGLAVGPL